MAQNDDAPPPDNPKSLSDYLKDREFSKQLMDDIIESSERSTGKEAPLSRRPPVASDEED